VTGIDQIVAASLPHTKTSEARLMAWIEACASINAYGPEGDVVECGVWRGGNIIAARKILSGRVCWLYDTFNGMTAPSVEDGSKAQWLYDEKKKAGRPFSACSRSDMEEAFRVAGILDHRFLRIVPGDVLETLKNASNLPEKIALLRLDTDWYASTKFELDVLYPRLAPGGTLIIDDYGHWLGARRAVDEYFDGRVEIKSIDYTAIRITKPWQ
jgi:O-methyltransferase